MEKITSKNNNLITQIAKLSTSGSARKKSGEFFLEGVRLCCDAVQCGVVVHTVLLTQTCSVKYRDKLVPLLAYAQKSVLISDEVAQKLADTVTPQGVFCVCERIQSNGEIDFTKKYIALEQVQDPSNLGAVIRTAEALGVDGVILAGGADPYNPKALRASMGAIFRLPMIINEELPSLLTQCKNKGMQVLATVPDGNAMPITHVSMQGGVIAVIGNEGNGISDAVKQLATQLVTIPMIGSSESLNAATAAAITMWEMMRGSHSETQ